MVKEKVGTDFILQTSCGIVDTGRIWFEDIVETISNFGKILRI